MIQVKIDTIQTTLKITKKLNDHISIDENKEHKQQSNHALIKFENHKTDLHGHNSPVLTSSFFLMLSFNFKH